MIFGLPGESTEGMLASIKKLAALRPDQVKFHMLYVMENTPLGKMFLEGEYEPIAREDFISTAANALTLLPPQTVVARITGDGAGEGMLAPEWSRRKIEVINDIDKYLYENNIYQGKLAKQ